MPCATFRTAVSRSIPVVQLTQLRKVFNKNFWALVFSRARKVLQYKVSRWTEPGPPILGVPIPGVIIGVAIATMQEPFTQKVDERTQKSPH
jgi:hypothetical protein